MIASSLIARLTALALFASVGFAEIAKENGVLVLTDANFDEAIELYPSGLLVEMYAPWCGHCKKLTPEYEAAAKILDERGLAIAKLDATEHKAAASKYGVKGFPTIKYIGKDVTLDYKGGRTAADIVQFVTKKSGPVVVTLDSKEAIDTFTNSADVAVVGFLSDPESEPSKAFVKTASSLDDFLFGIVSDSSLFDSFEVADNTVVLFKKFDELKATLDVSASTVEDISFFVGKESIPLLMVYSQETAQAIFSGPIKVHAIFFTDKIEGELLDAVQKAAKETKGKLLHVQVYPTEKRVLEFFGLKEEDCPTLLIVDMTEGSKKYFLGSKELTYETISNHESEYLKGNLIPTLKSEEVSDEDVAGNVKIVKGKSFESIVLDNDKDVFVKFYAPWCGHCKSLAPIWEEIADKLEDVESVVMAKFDATANEIDIPGINVKGFPTLYFFPGKDKSAPKMYQGGRDLDALLDYLKKEAAPFEIPEKKEPEIVAEEDVKDEL